MAAMVEFFGRNFPQAGRLYSALAQKDPNGGGGFYGGISYKSALGFLTMTKNPRTGQRLLQECLENERKQVRLDKQRENLGLGTKKGGRR